MLLGTRPQNEFTLSQRPRTPLSCLIRHQLIAGGMDQRILWLFFLLINKLQNGFNYTTTTTKNTNTPKSNNKQTDRSLMPINPNNKMPSACACFVQRKSILRYLHIIRVVEYIYLIFRVLKRLVNNVHNYIKNHYANEKKKL